ncbi:MAG: type III-A CRISPR-associated RAMP protein Csm4 [Chloroflexi bacterium]|nr:type III-A CRISPR-associated RAMP protein Csm4 [Chloroflexota bacterium]
MRVFYLTPRAPLFVGDLITTDKEATNEYLPSDTLFAAIVVAWGWQSQATLKARLARCYTKPAALCLSSAFPFAGHIRLFPMPRGLRLNMAADALMGKSLKRIRWVSEQVFMRLLSFADLSKENDKSNFLHNGSVWLLHEEISSLCKQLGQTEAELCFWRTQNNPRSAIDRLSSASNLFETAQLRFAPNCGLWLAASGETQWAEEALSLLQDSGIGGMRSIGHGAFTLNAENKPDWTDHAKSGYSVLLSRYSPLDEAETQNTLFAPESAYTLVTVGGWCTDDDGKAWRRKQVRLVQEGALLGTGAYGKWVNVQPDGVMDREVYRCGTAFNVALTNKMALSGAKK